MRWKRYAWRIKERTALRIVICLFIVFILMIALGILLLILAVK
jgi:heme A synthase